MAETTEAITEESIVTGWDFSTGSVKCLAFDLEGKVLAEARFPTDLYTEGGVSELNLMLLEGQARATTRAISNALAKLNRLEHWVAGGISATHHTCGRIDSDNNPVRRAICWNDQTLAEYHAKGLERLGGPEKAREYIGGPWAVRYSLSHLVKDEETLTDEQWKETRRILPHGPLAAGYLTGNFDAISVSSAASTGMMDLRTKKWSRPMLNAIANPEYQKQIEKNLPKIFAMDQTLGGLSPQIRVKYRHPYNPLIYPTLDDQAAGLVGGGAVDEGQVAIILGNSAVVNSSSNKAPEHDTLDAMRLNWGPYLWMRCYSNGAQFLDKLLSARPDWAKLEAEGRKVPPGCNGVSVLPFALSEPSLGVDKPRLEWSPKKPTQTGVLFRAALEALAYLIAVGVKEHQRCGQKITRITVSGGIAKSKLMLEILASVLNHRLDQVQSNEGTALGAAVVALAGHEASLRKQKGIPGKYTTADAVAQLIHFAEPVQPNPEWVASYAAGLQKFEMKIAK